MTSPDTMKFRFAFKIHPAGVLVFVLAFLFWDSHSALATAAALVLHEGAHLTMMKLCGMRECTVEITPFGGMADTKQFDRYSPMKRALSAFAGIASSAAAAFGCSALMLDHVFWEALFCANCSLALLNALPAWPLDGARVLVALAAYLGMEEQIKTVLSWVTTLAGIVMIALGLYGLWYGVINFSLFLLGPYLCYASRAEIVSDKVRRIDALQHPFHVSAMLPVKIMAAQSGHHEASFREILFHGTRCRYHVLAEIDPKSGSVRKWWTEQEMLDMLTGKTNN